MADVQAVEQRGADNRPSGSSSGRDEPAVSIPGPRDPADWAGDLTGDAAQAEEILALAVAVGHGRHADEPPHVVVAVEAPDGTEIDDDLGTSLPDVPARREAEDPLAGLPAQRDEFTCPVCFLVMHVSRRVGRVCVDCS